MQCSDAHAGVCTLNGSHTQGAHYLHQGAPAPPARMVVISRSESGTCTSAAWSPARPVHGQAQAP